MQYRSHIIIALLLIIAVQQGWTQSQANPTVPAAASTVPATPPKPPDMVCFGNGPDWSIQFTAGAAYAVGIGQSNAVWLGDFFYVPNLKVWAWHPTDPHAAGKISAFIHKAACIDPARHERFFYNAEVNLPEGDMVGGCCRKLKPGEAVVGPKGYVPPPNQPQQ